jgi:hypothetical protein
MKYLIQNPKTKGWLDYNGTEVNDPDMTSRVFNQKTPAEITIRAVVKEHQRLNEWHEAHSVDADWKPYPTEYIVVAFKLVMA